MKAVEYVNVRDGDIPGVTVREDGAYGELCGREYPVIGLVWSFAAGSYVPVLDIPQMDELPEREAAV